ncbi:MAG: ABC transporter permease [Ferruginibacter sp.]|nr:ABC transporter permease [Cytophagales bacterium]
MQEARKYPRRKKRLGSYPYLTVIFSITTALLVIGLCGLLILYARRLSGIVRQNLEVQVYLEKNLDAGQQDTLRRALSQKGYVARQDDSALVVFVSKEEAARKFIAQTGEDFSQFLGENPLRDAYTLRIRPDYYEAVRMKRIKADLERIRGVFEAAYVENLVEDLNRNIARLFLGLAIFGFSLLLTITILINNTIKLALFSQRFLIRSMQLVGATPAFIQQPFLLRAALQGFVSGILASGLLVLVLQVANRQVEGLILLQENEKIALLFAGLVLLGSLIGLLSSYLSVNKYLRTSLNDLY